MKGIQVSWFEIPVMDIHRASLFYESVFEITIQIKDFGALKMGMFPVSTGTGSSTGALVYHPTAYFPANPQGVLLYLNCDDISEKLNRVCAAGGEVLQEARQISEDFGSTGVFIVSEGNRMAFRSH